MCRGVGLACRSAPGTRSCLRATGETAAGWTRASSKSTVLRTLSALCSFTRFPALSELDTPPGRAPGLRGFRRDTRSRQDRGYPCTRRLHPLSQPVGVGVSAGVLDAREWRHTRSDWSRAGRYRSLYSAECRRPMLTKSDLLCALGGMSGPFYRYSSSLGAEERRTVPTGR